MATESCPVVYISYAWITIDHNGRPARAPDPKGKELADRLRAEGMDARLDIYALEGLHGQRQPVKVSGDPRDPWHAWAMQQIAESDVVLMLCTPEYVQPDGGGRDGAFWQWSQMDLADRINARARALWWDWLGILDECESKPQKFIPIGSGPYNADLVPGFVRGATYQDMDRSSAMESLLRRIRQVWHDRVPRSGVFVSYAHDDDETWLDSLLTKLKPLVDRHRVRVWTDREIAPGDEWHLRIQNALDLAKVGVMLVSPKFLESSYVASDELPKMLRAAESEGLTIFWVPVVRTDLNANPIAKFQAAHAPEKPLSELGQAEGEQALVNIVAKLGLLLDVAPMAAANVSSASVAVPREAVEASPSWKDRTPAERLAAAQERLRGTTDSFASLCSLAYAMKDADKRFTHARRLLLRARRHPEYTTQTTEKRRKVLQQLALCTYKDDDLPAERRFERALEWLKEIAPLEELADQESLCLAGAIFKRQWESTGLASCLRQSLAFYRRGHDAASPATPDYDGYGAINAAFVYDLVALEEERVSAASPTADEHRRAAADLRRQIVTLLPASPLVADKDRQWWLYVTIAEAHLGLGEYDKAKDWLAKALALADVYEWQRESTARQLAHLAHMIALSNADDGAGAYDVIQAAFWLSKEAREAIVLGRVGLALSGGGFRAALFHIGVLARLAELDVLRHVEVLSCVSGGSIIGSYYYLELRNEMLKTSDADMTQDKYIEIVARVEQEFLTGVQTNLRSSIPTNLWADLRMIFDPRYSRTTRIGDLYQSRLFDRVPASSAPSEQEGAQATRPKWINELPFTPRGAPPQFNPKSHNWTRGAKVPMLVINATTLNTGHNWQFTGTWMGEAASTIDNRVDSNDYLRRMYYSEAPTPYTNKGVPLGHAVAASACVPGLFPALKLPKLYQGRPVVRLVDGGVHDNQGMAALLDQDCSVILVSDASGQMRSEGNPPGGVFGGPTRSNSVLQARVRLAQYRELDARQRSGAIRGLMWVHLREGLQASAVNWEDCRDPFSPEDEGLIERENKPLLGYGIHRDIQDALARLRTDLDSFSDAEAHALMCSAYLMTKAALERKEHPFAHCPSRSEKWRFRAIEPNLKSPDSFRAPVPRALQVGEQLQLKAWRLSPVLAGLSTALLVAFGFVALYLLAALASRRGWIDAAAGGMKSPVAVVVGIGCLVAALTALRWGLRTYGRIGELAERATIGVLTVVLFVPMWIHRIVFDRIFLSRGQYGKRRDGM